MLEDFSIRPAEHSPVLRKSTMLNMDRMVGTITPKNVPSFWGSFLGAPVWVGLDSSCWPPPHAVAMPTARPHTAEVSRGVCSLDMVSGQMEQRG